MTLTQPVVNSPQYAWQSFGRDMCGFPGSDLLTKGSVKRRRWCDANLEACLRKPLVVSGHMAGALAVGQMQ